MPLYISPILLPTNTKQQWVLLVSKSVTSWASRNLCIAYNYTLQRVYCMPTYFINTEKLEEDILKAVEIILAKEQSG